MRLLTLFLSAATLIAASPVLAAPRHHQRAGGYYADVGGPVGRHWRPFNVGGMSSPGPIYRQGHYLGSDPDPRVRFEIARDPYFSRR
jgi:hypothetical protein